MKAAWATSVALLLGGAALPALAEGPATSATPVAPAPIATPCASSAISEVWNSSGGSGGGERIYGEAEYLLWWLKQTPVPPLVTSGDVVLGDFSGTLGGPATHIQFGGRDVGGQPFGGGRFTLGAWLDCDQTLGVETTWFFLESRRTLFNESGTADTTSFVGLPFFDVGLGVQNVQPVFGAGFNGDVNVRVLQRLWGAEANGRLALGGDTLRLALIGGFRFLAEDEGIDLTNVSTIEGFSTQSAESFTTHNRFYGSQIGGAATWCSGSLVAEVVGKIALGWTDETVNIHGSTINTIPDFGTSTAPISLLAQSSNSGHHTRSEFAVLPEFDIKIGYRVTDNLIATIGYTFLYISEVARPGNHIDLATNSVFPILPPSPPNTGHPAFSFNGSDFWAQGLSVGVELRF
jgi:hypothetical protein